jgi:hypothetical protein
VSDSSPLSPGGRGAGGEGARREGPISEIGSAGVSSSQYYRTRWEGCRADLEVQEQQLRRLGNARLIVFIVGVFGCLGLSPWPMALGVAAVVALSVFVYLVQLYRIAFAQLEADRALAQYFDRGLARIEDRWSLPEPTGEQFLDAQHPYAADLDLFGSGSLFQLLRLGWTPMGDATLALWLLNPATRDDALERQTAVRELAAGTEEREGAAVRAMGLAEHFQPNILLEWSTGRAAEFTTSERRITDVLVIAGAAAIAAWAGGYLSGWVVLIAFLVMMLWARRLQSRVETTLSGIDRQAERFGSLARLLKWFEGRSYTSPMLMRLHESWRGKRGAASGFIADLAEASDRLDWPRNVFFLPVALLMFWRTRLAFRVADWRRTHGPEVTTWLDALGEMESLHSLAALAYERPSYAFPDILTQGPTFDALQLGHPLLPADKCKCNDVSFGRSPQLLLVSGSNMSGKSTLLRTVGISVVLAMTGAPVKAKTLRLSVLHPGATLRIQDSLQTGISRFYAEILRLRQLLDLAKEKPLLFLVDEILAGTNSAERRQGAAGILQALLDRGAVGLATTHDLALTNLAEKWGDRARNVHFEDTWNDGQICFDYQLRPGVVSHGNALALMRAVGLDV